MLSTIWNWYTVRINSEFVGMSTRTGMPYWRNRLFVHIITYFVPISLLAIVPGILMCIISELYVLAVVELLAFLLLALSAFSRTLDIKLRKNLFLGVIHIIAFMLLYNLGSMGPGMLYLIVGTFFSVLVLPPNQAWQSTISILVICTSVALGLHLGLINSPLSKQYSLAAWLTVSCNTALISAIIVILLPKLFNKLEDASSRYQVVAKATSDTIYEWNLLEGRIAFNNGIEEMFGYSEKEITQAHDWWISKVHPEDRLQVLNRFTEVLASREQKNLQIEHRFLCADGNYKYVYNRASVVWNAKGIPTKFIGAVQDISKMKGYIKAIEKQNKSLAEISWIQSHRVRSPVATILGLIPLLEKDNNPSDNEFILSGIQEACINLDNIIREITAISKTTDAVDD